MPDDANPDWPSLIAEAVLARPKAMVGSRHDGGIQTASRPQKIICAGEVLYAVKFAQNNHGDGRATFTEQVVARAGRLINAPVPEVALVEVSDELVEAIRMSPSSHLDFQPTGGLHHGSLWADSFGPRQQDLAYADHNRGAFAALDVMHAWLQCTGDHQWIYRDSAPHDVLSVDHTPFLPGGASWSGETLNDAASIVDADGMFTVLALTAEDRLPALERLVAVTAAEIAEVVAAPPDEWGVGSIDREALASFLWTRRQSVADRLGA